MKTENTVYYVFSCCSITTIRLLFLNSAPLISTEPIKKLKKLIDCYQVCFYMELVIRIKIFTFQDYKILDSSVIRMVPMAKSRREVIYLETLFNFFSIKFYI